MLSKIAVAGALVFLPACGSGGPGICEQSIQNSLINPETAEFFDWHEAGKINFRQSIIDETFRGSGKPKSDKYKYESIIAERADEIVSQEKYDNAKFYGVRLKADSKIGLKVTSNLALFAFCTHWC